MTEPSFKSREFVYNYHLSVPFGPLGGIHADKGIGKLSLDGSLIVHGDAPATRVCTT